MPKYRVAVRGSDHIKLYDVEAKDGGEALRQGADLYWKDRIKEGDYSSLSVTFDIARYPD
ncbi:MAG TPA: hypothetical protein VNN19_10360 [bacterium]|nr:hypothetical protein [bacterium]